jgi:hypothetical protein
MTRWVLICTGRDGRPFFVVDEAGEPAVYASEEEADQVAAATPVCCALGYRAVELP